MVTQQQAVFGVEEEGAESVSQRGSRGHKRDFEKLFEASFSGYSRLQLTQSGICGSFDRMVAPTPSAN